MSARRRRGGAKARSGGCAGILVVVGLGLGGACVVAATRPHTDSVAPIASHGNPQGTPKPTPAPTPSVRAHEPAGTGAGPKAASPGSESLAASLHVKLGIPTDADPSDDHLMDKRVYAMSYNARYRTANWVAWNLRHGDLGRVKRRNKFEADHELPFGMPRVQASDYSKSGYDRGHLCPSGDRTATPEDNAATFLMTNMQPQLHELNDGPWRELEEHERELTDKGRKELFIVAGGLFGPNPPTIGQAQIAVPDASFKLIAVLDPGQGPGDVTITTPVLAAIMPNRAGVSQKTWRSYVVSIDEVERATGYDYLSKVAPSIQQVIEARASTSP